MKPRDAAMVRLKQVLSRLRGGRLRPFDEMWLAAALQRVVDGDKDPFGIRSGAGSRGVPGTKERNWEIAVFVHRLIADGKSRAEALELAGEKFHVSGSGNGTAEVAYLENKDAVAKAYAVPDALKRAAKEGRDLTSEERDAAMQYLFTEYAVDPD